MNYLQYNAPGRSYRQEIGFSTATSKKVGEMSDGRQERRFRRATKRSFRPNIKTGETMSLVFEEIETLN